MIGPRAVHFAPRAVPNPPPVPTEIKLHQASRVLEVSFSDGVVFRLPCEFLRVYSPSAEVRGHGPGQEMLQAGKLNVEITAIEPVGSYAVKLVFSDGHDTGLYSWDYLYELGRDQEPLWQRYLARLQETGASRDPAVPVRQSGPSGWKRL
jgi:DUF971 family protein